MFNYARDICHYRRGSLKDSTIQQLMMYMCSSRFDSEEKQAQFAKESDVLNDLIVNEDEGSEFDLLLISDDEDDQEIDEIETPREHGSESGVILPPDVPDLPPPCLTAPSEKALGKRRKSVLSVSDDGQLPGSSWVRTSGRQRKAPRFYE